MTGPKPEARSPKPDRARAQGVPLSDAVPVARQICEALQAAHEHGVIHRDLKPANIKITRAGSVKVLDFGLAKLVEGSPPATGPAQAGHYREAAAGPGSVWLQPDLSQSPTMSLAATRAGVILGTAAYMAPEQARGKDVDKRTDIWAFGCVFYKMLTGKRAFPGDDVSDTLATVLKSEPEWSALPPDVPPAIRMLIQRCLEKDRNRRVADISAALFLINEPTALPAVGAPTAPAAAVRPPGWRRVATYAVVVLAASVVVGTAVWFAARASVPPPRVSRLLITPSSTAALTITDSDRALAITPDGSRIVYVGNNGTQLFVRALDGLEPVAIYKGAPRDPFVSPDGQWVGFIDTNTTLKKIAITGGPPVTLARLDGNIRSSERAGARNLFWQAADGTGAVERLTESPNPQSAVAVSPDGTRVIFNETTPATGDVMQVQLDGARPSTSSGRGDLVEPRRVMPLVQTPFTERNGVISPDGHWLLYEANDSGQFEIHVRPFPQVNSGHWQVSTGGGTRPLWARDGQELFYLSPAGALMRVGVERSQTWSATAPTKLLNEGYFAPSGANPGRTYDVSPDGQRFLMIKQGGGSDQTAAPTSVVVVQNWSEELKRLVPSK